MAAAACKEYEERKRVWLAERGILVQDVVLNIHTEIMVQLPQRSDESTVVLWLREWLGDIEVRKEDIRCSRAGDARVYFKTAKLECMEAALVQLNGADFFRHGKVSAQYYYAPNTYTNKSLANAINTIESLTIEIDSYKVEIDRLKDEDLKRVDVERIRVDEERKQREQLEELNRQQQQTIDRQLESIARLDAELVAVRERADAQASEPVSQQLILPGTGGRINMTSLIDRTNLARTHLLRVGAMMVEAGDLMANAVADLNMVEAEARDFEVLEVPSDRAAEATVLN